MSAPSPFEALLPLATAAHMRKSGSLKWSVGAPLGCFVAEMDFQPAPVIRQALSEWALEGSFGYQPPALLADFQDAVANYYSGFGWRPEPRLIRPASDLVTLFEHITSEFMTKDQPIILLTPAYMNFLALARESSHPMRTVSMHRNLQTQLWELDWDALELAMVDGGLLVLINPHNPIGKSYTREELAGIADLAHRYGVRVFADEIHAPLTLGSTQHVPFATVSETAAQVAITGFSATKGFSIPGTKAAAVIFSNPADLEVWHRKGMALEFATANSGFVATVAALNEGQQWLQEVRKYLQANRDLVERLVQDHLPGAIYLPPQSTYLAWLDLRGTPNYRNHEATQNTSLAGNLAKACGVLATDGEECGPEGVGHIRVNFATHQDTLREIFEALGSVLA